MEEILIVDRIENGYAVCETEQGEKKDIPLSETKDVHEGDVLILKDSVYISDKDKTESRRKGYSPYRKTCGLDYMLRGIDRNGKDLFTLINEKLSGLSKGHKLIANYILSHYDKAAFMTAQKLGKPLASANQRW